MQFSIERDFPNLTTGSASFMSWVKDGVGKRTNIAVESHVHFGRYGSIHITIIVAGEGRTSQLLTEIAKGELTQLAYWIGAEVGLSRKLQEVEVIPTIYRNGHRLCFGPRGIDDLDKLF